MVKDPSVYAASTGGKYVSYGKLLNPVSQMLGGGDKYPEFMASMFPGNPEAAWMLSKVGAVGLLAAALAGGIRLSGHLTRVRGMKDRDAPAAGLQSQISTTFDMSLAPPATGQKKEAKTKYNYPKQSLMLPDPGDVWTNVRRTGIPLGAALLSVVAAWKGADYLADKRRNQILSQMVQDKNDKIKQLIQVRTRVAKGIATDAEVKEALEDETQQDAAYVKTAGEKGEVRRAPGMFLRPVITGMPLLLLALSAAGAAGAYKYFSAEDANNLRYKALKKGLTEYARGKANITPINLIPHDAEDYFKALDAEQAHPNKRTAREEPEIVATNLPVKVTV